MIEISLRHALILYSSLLGLIVLGIWLYTEVTARRSYHFLEKQFLWRCVFCGYIYLDEAAESVSQCPRCSSYNSVDDRRARYVRARAATPELRAPEPPAKPLRNPSRRKRPHQRRRGPRRR